MFHGTPGAHVPACAQLELDGAFSDVAAVGLWVTEYADIVPDSGLMLDVYLLTARNDLSSASGAVRCARSLNLTARVRHMVYCPPASNVLFVWIGRYWNGSRFGGVDEVEVYRGGGCATAATQSRLGHDARQMITRTCTGDME